MVRIRYILTGFSKGTLEHLREAVMVPVSFSITYPDAVCSRAAILVAPVVIFSMTARLGRSWRRRAIRGSSYTDGARAAQ